MECNTQEIFRPDIFWYSAPTQIQLPFNIVGLVAFELFAMHWCAAYRSTASPSRAATGPSSAACSHSLRGPRETLPVAPMRISLTSPRGCCRVESKRGLDLKNPNSQNQDPIFTNYKLPDHQVRCH